MTTVPVVEFSPFSSAVRHDPFPYYEPLRAAGPVFRTDVDGYDVFGLSRYRDVRRAVADPISFSSVGGLGLHPLDRIQAGVLVASDPPDHTRIRRAVGKHMSPRAMTELHQSIRERASATVAELVTRDTFDVITDLAEPFTVGVVADLVGLPEAGRELFPAWTAAGFSSRGPLAVRNPESDDLLDRMMGYIGELAIRREVEPGRVAYQVFQAAEQGMISMDEAVSVIFGGFVLAGLHTSILFFGNTIAQFAEFPDQWTLLREDPATFIPAAIEESARRESPLQSFFRTAGPKAVVDGVPIPEGARVLMMIGSANRDPRYWHDPDVFDITRSLGTSGTSSLASHVGFGTGQHSCLGAPLLRTEAAAVLEAFVDCGVSGFEFSAPPVRGDTVAHGWNTVAVTVTRD